MNNTNGSLDFKARVDIESLKTDMSKIRDEFKSISSTAKAEGQKTQSTINNLLKGAGAMFTIGAAKQFVGKIVEIRGAFQQLEVSFETMLGSKEKSVQMMDDVVKFAAKTPFTLQEVAGGTKQLLAFNVAQNKVIPTLKAMGDVSAGLNVPIGRLIANFGQVKMAGKLTGRELKDFVMAGVPLIDELSKNMGHSKTEISSMVSAGQIGFKDVENAFTSMSSAGGKFADLMDKQSGTITGQISNLEDAVDKMFNDIGKSSEDVIGGLIDGAGFLVENYKTVGDIIKGLIVTYGTYRAALIVSSVAQGIATEMAYAQALANTTLSTSQKLGATMSMRFSRAMKALNAQMLLNPYVLVSVAVVGIGYAFYKMATQTTLAEDAVRNFNESMDESESSIREETLAVDDLFDDLARLTEGTEAYDKVKSKIQSQYGNYLKGLKSEVKSLRDIEGAYKAITIGIREKYMAEAKSKTLKDVNEEANKEEIEYKKKIREAIERKYGKQTKESQRVFKEIKLALEKGGDISGKAEQEIGQFDTGKNVLGHSANYVEEYVKGIKRVRRELDEATKSVNQLYDKAEEDKPKNGKNTVKLETLSLKELETKLKKELQLRKEYKDITDSMTRKRNASEIGYFKDKTEKIDALKKKIKQRKKNLGIETKRKKSGARVSSSSSKPKNEFDLVAYQRKKDRALEDLKYNNRIKSLKAEKVGYDLSLALAEEDGKRKIAILKRQQEDKMLDIDKNALSSKKAGQKGFNAEGQKAEYNNTYDIARKQQEIENNKFTRKLQKDHLNKLLGGLKTYEKERADLVMKRNLTDFELKNNGASKEQRKLVMDKTNEEIAKLDNASKEHGSKIADFYKDATTKSLKELEQFAKDGERVLNQIKSGKKFNPNDNPLDFTEEQFNELKKSENTEKFENNLKKIKEEAYLLKDPFDQLNVSVKELFNGGKGDLTAKLSKVKDSLGQVSEIAGFVSSSLNDLAEGTGSEALSEASRTINDIVEVASKTMEGAELGAKMGGTVGAVVGGVIGLGSSLVKIIGGRKDEKKEKEIQRLQQSVKGLTVDYANLGREIGNAYGQDASNLIAQQDNLLKQKNRNLEQQIQNEQGKKKSDGSKIDGMYDQMRANNEMMKANKDKALDVLFGSDIKSAINGFADAYANAWKKGDEKAMESGDIVKNMLLGMLKQTASSEIKEKVDKLRRWMSYYMEDGVLGVGEERVLKSLGEEIKQKQDSIYSGFEGLLNDDDSTKREAKEKKGMAQMTQETGTALDGKFTLSIELQRRALDLSKEFSVNLKMLQVNSSKQLDNLVSIKNNTHHLIEIKDAITNINDKGINLKQ